jgi:hypothetical protein
MTLKKEFDLKKFCTPPNGQKVKIKQMGHLKNYF